MKEINESNKGYTYLAPSKTTKAEGKVTGKMKAWNTFLNNPNIIENLVEIDGVWQRGKEEVTFN